jgi:hypothetical protein
VLLMRGAGMRLDVLGLGLGDRWDRQAWCRVLGLWRRASLYTIFDGGGGFRVFLPWLLLLLSAVEKCVC